MYSFLYYPSLFLLIYLLTTLFFFAMNAFLPHPPRLLGFIARSLAAYATLIICAAYGTFACLALRIFNLHYRYGLWTTSSAFKWISLFVMGVRFKILDDGRALLDGPRPMVIIGNHQTELDILFLGEIWPQYCSVTAKESLKYVPFLGWFMALSGTVFINRVDRSQAMKAFEGAATRMRDLKQNVFIFPEGTRSYTAEPVLLPFKKGAFHLAVQAGVDILPVVAENYSKVLNVERRQFGTGTIRIKGMSALFPLLPGYLLLTPADQH
jgi:lysophosphatidate acyltransferase